MIVPWTTYRGITIATMNSNVSSKERAGSNWRERRRFWNDAYPLLPL